MANGLTPPGYGLIKTGNVPAAICGDVPKFLAYATVMAAPDKNSALWQAVQGATSATVSVQNPQNFPNVWIAYKLIGAATPRPCAAKGSITFNLPPTTTLIMFTIYFTSKPTAVGITLAWNANEIQPYTQ